MTEGRATVYVASDAAGRVLYVGMSLHYIARLLSHASSSPWYWTVAHIDFYHHGSEVAARAHERELIWDLDPLFNIQGTPGRANAGSR